MLPGRGELPTVGHMGRIHLKGMPFLSLQYAKGYRKKYYVVLKWYIKGSPKCAAK